MEYRKIDSDVLPYLANLLSHVDWELLIFDKELCGSKAFELFLLKFRDLFDIVFPPKYHRCSENKHQTKPALKKKRANIYVDFKQNKQLQTLKSWVLLLHDLYKNANDAGDRNRYYNLYLRNKTQYKNCLNRAKREANVKFIKEASNPCKAAWSLIKTNREQPKAFKCPASPDQFNNFFIEAVNEIVDSMPDSSDNAAQLVNNLASLNRNELGWSTWQEVDPDSIVKIAKSFKNSSCTDVYGMSAVVLKSCVQTIASPLAELINKCLSQGIFPEELKVAKTIPIYKKGDPGLLKSYRPISIIPVVAKVFETVIYQQLVSYFEGNELFAPSQHGFRRKRSTISAITSIIENIYNAFEEEESVLLTLLDLSKAFDCVSHEILLKKLRKYGISGAVYGVFQSYLTNRKQVVSIRGATSNMITVKNGVPQGSALGPVLFLILINDFNVSCESLLYADDTTLATRAHDMRTLSLGASFSLAEAKDWFKLNNLKLNEDKTQSLLCSLWNRPDAVGSEAAVRLLGITVDGKLCWDRHVDDVCKKLTRVNFLLRKLSTQVTPEYLVLAYFGLFHCHLNYGLILWGHSSSTSRVLIQQKTAVRILTSSGHRDHCRQLFQQLGVLTVHSQYILNCLLSLKSNPSAELVRREQRCGYQLRNCKNLDVPRCRLSKTLNCYPNLAYKMFNKLPNTFRELEPPLFKKKLKSWLLKKSFYGMEEFFSAKTDDLL